MWCLLLLKKGFDQNKVLTIINLCLLTVFLKQVSQNLSKSIDRLEPDDDPIY